LESSLVSRAQAQTGLNVKTLVGKLTAQDATLLVPSDKMYAQYKQEFNLRTAKLPALRILVRTTQGLAISLSWLKENQIPFAIRCGGHSFEGFSQSSTVVVDTRLMNQIQIDPISKVLTVGGGASLGQIYKAVGEQGLAFPAGSCPNVGVSGHVLGGGYGLLSRSLGLACDSMLAAEIVMADGKIVTASAQSNPDLFWALKGGGGGSFGVVSRYKFRTYPVTKVSVFGISWNLPKENAGAVFRNWQAWNQSASSGVTSLFRINKNKNGSFYLHAVGQSIHSETWLKSEIQPLLDIEPSSLTVKGMSFLDGVRRFAGKEDYSSVYMKGKSDYIYKEMSEEGIQVAFAGMEKQNAGTIGMAFDGYGGQIAKIGSLDTAFYHRKARSVIQYFCQWGSAVNTESRLKIIREYHQSMRPYVSGYAYVNYCDTDIKNWHQAYWGENFEKLVAVKRKWDPENFFKHAQSIPVKV
jgi:FAD/FMN-containing dehydrogenase